MLRLDAYSQAAGTSYRKWRDINAPNPYSGLNGSHIADGEFGPVSLNDATNSVETAASATTNQTILKADPRSLLSRLPPREMTPSKVQDMSEDMMVNRFDWDRAGPIEVIERDGVRIIHDGHHRAAAAIEAGLEHVPVIQKTVPDNVWQKYYLDMLEANGVF